MAFIITENKIETAVFKYLDSKKFTIKETPNNYYFMNNEDDEFYTIGVAKDGILCITYLGLLLEIERFFSIKYPESEYILNRYVKKILDIDIYHNKITTYKLQIR